MQLQKLMPEGCSCAPELCDGSVDPDTGQHAQWCCAGLQVVEGESTPNPVPHLMSNRVWRLMGGGHYGDL